MEKVRVGNWVNIGVDLDEFEMRAMERVSREAKSEVIGLQYMSEVVEGRSELTSRLEHPASAS